MTKRTAADFAADVSDPWTYELKSGRVLQPRPRSHFTYDEQQAEAQLSMAWGLRMLQYERGEVPTDDAPESQFLWALKVRFSDPGVYVDTGGTSGTGKNAKSTIPDFDEFWAEVHSSMPLGTPAVEADPEAKPPVKARRATGLHKLIDELDEHYVEAAPGTDVEVSAAAAELQGDAAGK